MKRVTPEESNWLWVKCSCSTPDHVIAFKWERWDWSDGSEVDLYIETQMRREERWWKRLWTAIRYIFKATPCQFGYWSCAIVDEDQAAEIRDLMTEYIEVAERYRSERKSLQEEAKSETP
jgi:hypothetical protein